MTEVEAPLARTKPVSPSKLAVHAQCPLRYLYETERPPVAALPRGPGAVKGMAVHGLIESCRGKDTPVRLALKQDLCARLTNYLSRGDGGSLAMHAIGLHGLHGIFTRREIVGACQFAAGVLARYGEQVSRPIRQAYRGPRGDSKSPFGNEVWIEDAGLDLAGRADLVYRAEDRAVHVVDFKSSRIGADDPQHEQYILQLVAYALLVERKVAAARMVIELATPDGFWKLDVDDSHRAMALAAVASVTRQFPRDMPQEPSALAVRGRHCATCNYRVSCAAYHSGLSDAGGMMPAHGGYDLAGTVTAKKVSGGIASLVIRRRAGAACRLDGIPEQTWPGIAAGDELSAFNVGCREMSVYSRSPANFFVFRPDDPPASAYKAVLRVSQSSRGAQVAAVH